jgi:hypothetical protein
MVRIDWLTAVSLLLHYARALGKTQASRGVRFAFYTLYVLYMVINEIIHKEHI